MMNSEINKVELENSISGTLACHKQPVIATKKVPLRDVQNNSSNLKHDTCLENLPPLEEKPVLDAAKICGTKRLAPENPSIHTYPHILSKNGANEHFNYARRKYELDGSRGRNQGNMEILMGHPKSANFPYMQQDLTSKQSQVKAKNMHYGPFGATNHTASRTTVVVPKVEVPQLKQSLDEQWTERFIRLQNFIKHCDQSDQTETIRSLLHLSSSELNRHAIELEKRAIQLTIEEGKEIQRMQALNIFRKPTSNSKPNQTTQLIQPKK